MPFDEQIAPDNQCVLNAAAMLDPGEPRLIPPRY